MFQQQFVQLLIILNLLVNTWGELEFTRQNKKIKF